MAEHRVAARDELAPQRGVAVDVEGHAIALFRVGDEVHAVGRWCPHQWADLCDGWVEEGRVVCAGHLWAFALDDGSLPGNATFRLPVYPCRTDPTGGVHVTIP